MKDSQTEEIVRGFAMAAANGRSPDLGHHEGELPRTWLLDGAGNSSQWRSKSLERYNLGRSE